MLLIHNCSASFNSAARSSVVLRRGSFLLTNLVNRRTVAVTRSSLVFVLNLWQSIIFSRSTELSLFDVRPASECVITGGCLSNSVKASPVSLLVGCGSSGHCSSGHLRKRGPFHQVSRCVSSLPEHPRDGKSAGLISPGQCLHCSFLVNSLIS